MDVLNLLDALDDAQQDLHIFRTIRDRMNPFEEYNNESFKSRYKLTKGSAHDLIKILENRMPNSTRNCAIPPALQANNNFYFFDSIGSIRSTMHCTSNSISSVENF